ncbi:MAG: hypothetical protein K2Y05_08880, partial [Hyphomicrobiaceae bacterium]|nr:hypothetical protein [Hyphomicrobiaceae bacterium]
RDCRPFARADQRRTYGQIDALISEVANNTPGIVTIDPKAVFCPGEDCITVRDGELLLRDTTHLTTTGSDFAVNGLRSDLLTALAGRPLAAGPPISNQPIATPPITDPGTK